MIIRSWCGRVPAARAEAFRAHLAATGIADYRAQPGLAEIALWRRDCEGWAIFTLVSSWRDMASIRAYAGPDPDRAVLYPGDDAFELIPDSFVTHYELVERLPCKCE